MSAESGGTASRCHIGLRRGGHRVSAGAAPI